MGHIRIMIYDIRLWIPETAARLQVVTPELGVDDTFFLRHILHELGRLLGRHQITRDRVDKALSEEQPGKERTRC